MHPIVMKRKNIIGLTLIAGVLFFSACHTKTYRTPKNIYMPDMHYSVAYDAYTENPVFADNQSSRMPVEGTIARNSSLPYHVPESDSGYAYSGTIQNPLEITDSVLNEGQRLFNIYCAICHGEKLDGDGPLYKGGSGPYIAAPANFISGPKSTLPQGTVFYVATYGIRNMGSYASQLDKEQRWMVAAYIHNVQKEGGATDAVFDSTMNKMQADYLQMQ